MPEAPATRTATPLPTRTSRRGEGHHTTPGTGSRTASRTVRPPSRAASAQRTVENALAPTRSTTLQTLGGSRVAGYRPCRNAWEEHA
jgi:hypothetical protein